MYVYLNSVISILEVYKSIILDFLHSFDFAVLFEAFLQFFFRTILRQISYVKHAYLKAEWFITTIRLGHGATNEN